MAAASSRSAGIEDPDVDLRAPAGPARASDAAVIRHGHAGPGDRLLDRPGEDGAAEPRRRWLGRPGRPVGSDDDVEMDEPTALELDHLDVGEAGQRAQLARLSPAGPATSR